VSQRNREKGGGFRNPLGGVGVYSNVEGGGGGDRLVEGVRRGDNIGVI